MFLKGQYFKSMCKERKPFVTFGGILLITIQVRKNKAFFIREYSTSTLAAEVFDQQSLNFQISKHAFKGTGLIPGFTSAYINREKYPKFLLALSVHAFLQLVEFVAYRSFSHEVSAAIFVYKTMNRRPCLRTK